jgi:Leucine-rich repeat (LRR) protein
VNELEKLEILDISYNAVEHLENIDKLAHLECLYLNANRIGEYQELQLLKANAKLSTISLFGNDVSKEPGYRMKLVELLPEIDDIDGTPMKTSYKIVFGSSKSVEGQAKAE